MNISEYTKESIEEGFKKIYVNLSSIEENDKEYIYWFSGAVCMINKDMEFDNIEDIISYTKFNRKNIKELRSIDKISYLKAEEVEPYAIKFDVVNMLSYCVFLKDAKFEEAIKKYYADEMHRKRSKLFVDVKLEFERIKREYYKDNSN